MTTTLLRPRARPLRSFVHAARALAACALIASLWPAQAQDIEPRAYSNAPVGVNFLVAGYVHSHGGLSLDPSLPLTNARLDTNVVVLAYARVLDLWGVSASSTSSFPTSRCPAPATMSANPCNARSTVSRTRRSDSPPISTGR